jgi:glycosyltransferase involved in cell wall biosynthesis
MKICFVTEYFPKNDKLEIKGGVEIAAFNEAYYLSKNNDITVLTSYEEETKRKTEIGNIKIIACGKKRSYTQKKSYKKRLSFIKAAYDTGKKLDLDIIIGYNFITYPVAWKISQKLNIPCVARYHDVWIGKWIKNIGIFGIFGEILERYFLSRDVDLILAVSNFTANNLKKHFPKNKIAVVPNIVEFNKIKSTKFKKKTISCVSRLVEYKRIEDLILAMDIIINKDNNFKNLQCKIIGVGPMKKKLELITKEKNLEKNITFCGFVKKHENVLKVINSSYIFCLPSKVEGFGIVIVEALGCEVPFVTSNISPIIEISEKKGGLFFQAENHEDLAKKLKLLLKEKKLYENLKKEGLEQYKKYKGENIARKLEKYYTSLIN